MLPIDYSDMSESFLLKAYSTTLPYLSLQTTTLILGFSLDSYKARVSVPWSQMYTRENPLLPLSFPLSYSSLIRASISTVVPIKPKIAMPYSLAQTVVMESEHWIVIDSFGLPVIITECQCMLRMGNSAIQTTYLSSELFPTQHIGKILQKGMLLPTLPQPRAVFAKSLTSQRNLRKALQGGRWYSKGLRYQWICKSFIKFNILGRYRDSSGPLKNASFHKDGNLRQDIWQKWGDEINSIENSMVLEQGINKSISNHVYLRKINSKNMQSYHDSKFAIVRSRVMANPREWHWPNEIAIWNVWWRVWELEVTNCDLQFRQARLEIRSFFVFQNKERHVIIHII